MQKIQLKNSPYQTSDVREYEGYTVVPHRSGSRTDYYRVYTPDNVLLNYKFYYSVWDNKQQKYVYSDWDYEVTSGAYYNDKSYRLTNLKECKRLIEDHITGENNDL
jgi:hypothetical protein